jgi:2-polyprenyl-3-methyl-5-hydroxy-6-metoxy-1,4-benzoquinol methylase
MKTEKYQEGFFDERPGLYPWPDLLVKFGFSKSYKPRDVKFKKYLGLLGIKKDGKVLDVGCGEGIFLARVARTYKAVGTGVDISKKSIETAWQWQKLGLKFKVVQATKLPFPDESFNHVLSFDVLEHIRNQSKALAEMVRVLKPGGGLLIYTINRNQHYTWNFWLNKLGVDVYKRVAHDSSLFLEPRWVKKELERMGIGVERLELYGSFFTLALDEAIMLFILGLKKLGFFSPSSRFKTALGRVFLTLADFLSRFLLAPLEVLEIPWKKAGYSNSFFVLGRKKDKK